MKLLKLSFAIVALALLASTSKAEEKADAPKPADAAPAEVKPAEVKAADAKPADAAVTDKPKTETVEPAKAPEGVHQNESLVGDLSKGSPDAKNKDKAAKKAAKKGTAGDALILHIAVHEGDKKEMKRGKDITLTASGDVLAQLKTFAEKNAHIKVTGALDGNTMTVKEVSEAPAEPAGKKKKKNNA